jgi:hypothetical protein
MALTSEHEAGLRAAREAMAETFWENGMEPDYSLASLEGLERVLGKYRRLLAENPSALSPEALGRLHLRAAAYLAEVLQRAVSGTDLSLEDGEMSVSVPSGLIPQITWSMKPLNRVARLLREEDGEGTLVAWVAFAAVMAASPGPSPGAGDGPGPDREA